MGGSQSKFKQWRRVSRAGNVSRIASPQGSQTLDMYQELFQSQQHLDQAVAHIQKRKTRYSNELLNVLKVIDYQVKQASKMCSTYHSMAIVTQPIQRRLSDLSEFNQARVLYVLHQILNGFGHIFKNQQKHFDITEEMIFQNADDIIKVWFNKNPALNYPELQYIKTTSGEQTQNRIIQSALDMVRSRTIGRQFSPQLQKYFNQNLKQPYSFGLTIDIIKRFIFESEIDNQFTQYLLKIPNKHQQQPIAHVRTLSSTPSTLTSPPLVLPSQTIQFYQANQSFKPATEFKYQIQAPFAHSKFVITDPINSNETTHGRPPASGQSNSRGLAPPLVKLTPLNVQSRGPLLSQTMGLRQRVVIEGGNGNQQVKSYY